MAYKKTSSYLIDKRRELVAQAMVKGWTIPLIVKALEKVPEMRNGKGEPFQKSTICLDRQTVLKQWQENTMQNAGAHVARRLAVLNEVERQAWTASNNPRKNLELVLKASDRIAKLLGLNAPDRQEITGAGGGPVSFGFTNAAAAELLDRIIEGPSFELPDADAEEVEK